MGEEVGPNLLSVLQEAQVAVNLLDVVFAPTLVFLGVIISSRARKNANYLVPALNVLELRLQCIRSTAVRLPCHFFDGLDNGLHGASLLDVHISVKSL